MRCSRCGNEILLGEDLLITTYDDQPEDAGPAPAIIYPIVFCARCAEHRRKMWLLFMWMPIILVLGLIVVVGLL